MKRTKFIALALVVAVMLMGAAYAAWTDTLYLDTTVHTGNFDMQISKVTTRTGDNEIQNEVQEHNGNISFHKFDWTHLGSAPYIKDNSTTAVVELKDLYPGGVVQIDLEMINKGTIPAKLKSVTVGSMTESVPGLFSLLNAQTSWKADIDGPGPRTTKDDWKHVENWMYWRGLQDAMDQLVKSTQDYNLVIEPEGFLALGDGTEDGCIQIKLDPGADNRYQNADCSFKITFNWEQWAEDPVANPYQDYNGDGDIIGVATKLP